MQTSFLPSQHQSFSSGLSCRVLVNHLAAVNTESNQSHRLWNLYKDSLPLQTSSSSLDTSTFSFKTSKLTEVIHLIFNQEAAFWSSKV